MPLPKPRTGEKQNDFIGRCIRFVKKDKPETPNDQAVAICFDTWRRAKGRRQSLEMEIKKEKIKKKKYDEEGREIVAENVPVIFNTRLQTLDE